MVVKNKQIQTNIDLLLLLCFSYFETHKNLFTFATELQLYLY